MKLNFPKSWFEKRIPDDEGEVGAGSLPKPPSFSENDQISESSSSMTLIYVFAFILGVILGKYGLAFLFTAK